MRCGGSYKSVCTTTTGSRTWKRCASVSRRNGTIWTRKWLTARLVNGASNWQPALQPAEDILNIHSEHYCICSHTDWHVLNLVSFAEFRVKQIEFSCTSNGSVVILNFRISQGSVATQLRWGGNCHHSYSVFFGICQWKNCENWLILAEVMTKKQSGCFFWNTVYMEIVYIHSHKHTQPFYGHYTGQPVIAGSLGRILLQQSFTARMPLQMATSTFRLWRRQHFSSAVIAKQWVTLSFRLNQVLN